jgi:hypothetical protein
MSKKRRSKKLKTRKCEGRAVIIIMFLRLKPKYRFIINFCLSQNSILYSPDNLLSLPDI